jgi:hypothetical protein
MNKIKIKKKNVTRTISSRKDLPYETRKGINEKDQKEFKLVQCTKKAF